MFDLVHNNKKLAQVIMALLVLPFALWGIDSYTRSGNQDNVVAMVGDVEITTREFENTVRVQQDRLRKQLGNSLDVAMFETPEFRRAALENLVSRRLLIAYAEKSGLVATDEQVARLIGSIPEFESDGKFDRKRYSEVLSGRNMSSVAFEARLRDDLLGQQAQDDYMQNGFSSIYSAENIIRLNEQQRMVSVLSLPFRQFEAQARVDDDDVKRYYGQHSDEFRVPEQAKVEYVKLSIDTLLSKADVSRDEIREYYEGHLSEFGSPEERQAAHILIATSADASPAEQEAVKAKAEELLKQIRSSPARFAELARENSEDPGSAANGGDLGFFGRGMMVKPFEDAVFSLEKGEISGVVKSDFGYHIIKLLAVKPSMVPSFDEVREGIANRLRQQKAADLFAELAEKFSNAVYEQSDTLKPAAELVGAKIELSGWLTKGGMAAEPWVPEILQAVFNEDAVKNKRNTPAIEVGENTLLAARVIDYRPATVQALEEVSGSIRQKLLRQQAIDLAAKQGRVLIDQLQAGENQKLAWKKIPPLSRMQPGNLDAGLARLVFQADAAALPQYVGVTTAMGDYVIARVEAISEGKVVSDGTRADYQRQLRLLTGEEMMRALLLASRQEIDVTINLPEMENQQ